MITQSNLLHRLDGVQRLCPEMRLGQLFATIAMLGEDSTGRSLWEIEDDEFLEALERFSADLRRQSPIGWHVVVRSLPFHSRGISLGRIRGEA